MGGEEGFRDQSVGPFFFFFFKVYSASACLREVNEHCNVHRLRFGGKINFFHVSEIIVKRYLSNKNFLLKESKLCLNPLDTIGF